MSESRVKAETTFDLPKGFEQFVTRWESSESAKAVDKMYGWESGKASLKAGQIRKRYGIDLKKFKRGPSAINQLEAKRLLTAIRSGEMQNTPLEEALDTLDIPA